MEDYRTIRGTAVGEYEEKKSRFIAQLSFADSEEAAVAFLEQVRAANRTARHNVYAYRLREGNRERYSDDGEPAKTAGTPALEVLQHSGLTDLIVVITRYFGGVLLGTGGLVRLCKEIGYTGLKDMRQQLYLHYSAEPQVEVDPTVHFSDLREGKSAQEILQNVTAASLQALQRTSKLMDPAAYQTASDWLLQSKSIKLFGMGASGLVASDLCDKLLRIGKNAIFNFNSHVQLSYSATLTKDDTAVFISNTGKTQEILQALEAVQASGCHTIGITHYSKSPLSAGCKLLLYTSSKEVYVRSGAMSSRLAQLMVVDALFTVLASQDYAAIQGTLESSYQICMSHRVDHR